MQPQVDLFLGHMGMIIQSITIPELLCPPQRPLGKREVCILSSEERGIPI